jgi:hypothetical protein
MRLPWKRLLGQRRKTVTAMDHFAVVQDAYPDPDWHVVASLLAKSLGLPAATANRQAKRSYGFLAENLTENLAQGLHRACAEQGIATQVVPQEKVVAFPRPTRAHQIRFAADVLWIHTPDRDGERPVPWDTVALIAAARVMRTETHRRWLSDYDSRDDSSAVVSLDFAQEQAEHLADLFAALPNGQFVGFRFLSRELNYADALGEAAPDVLVNTNARLDGFRLVMSRIVAQSSKAEIPPDTIALLQGPGPGDLRSTPATNLDDFNGRNRWLLQQARLRRDADPTKTV